MHGPFPFQLLLSFIITNTITVMIETKQQFQSNSMMFYQTLPACYPSWGRGEAR